MRQEMTGWQWHQLDHMQKPFAPHSRQITTGQHLIIEFFKGRMFFLMPNQQRQSTEG